MPVVLARRCLVRASHGAVGGRRRRRAGPGAASAVLALLGPAGAAPAAAAAPTVPSGFTITRLAGAPAGATNCDDLARLDGHLFVTCQNATLSSGGGGASTIAEYADDGRLVAQWSLPDKADGIGADPRNHRVLVTLNEDAHSHLAAITPKAPAGQQVTDYAYSPGPPDSPATTGALHTGGGTDSVSVDSAGHIYITASHPKGHAGTAVFRVALTEPPSAGGRGTAALSPTWRDDATAANGNTASGTVKLALGDVDSGAIVPRSSPRYGGSFVIDDQTSLQLVFARDINQGTGLTALKTPFGLDDIRWATSDGGTLYVVDKGAPAAAGVSSLYKVTGPFVAGTALAANDGLGDQVVKVDLASGALTPLVRHLTTAKGLVYVEAGGSEAALATGPTAGAGSGTGSATVAAIIGGAAVVVALAGAAYFLSRRRRSG